MKFFHMIFLILLLSSCGTLKVSPQGCKTQIGVWGDDKFSPDITLRKNFRIWFNDNELKISQLLKENNYNCSQIEKMRVIIEQKFFVDRVVTLEIKKK